MLFSFIAGFVSCYFYMTYGVDQEGIWISNKEFDGE